MTYRDIDLPFSFFGCLECYLLEVMSYMSHVYLIEDATSKELHYCKNTFFYVLVHVKTYKCVCICVRGGGGI